VFCGCRFDSVVKPCWAEDPAARPDFNAICASIEHFRRGQQTGEDYYTPGQSYYMKTDGKTYADRPNTSFGF